MDERALNVLERHAHRRLGVRRGVAATCMLASFLFGAPGTRWRSARAETVTARVEWEAPASCADTGVLFEKLNSLLGHEPTTLGQISRVRGVVAQSAEGYRLTLEVFEPGRRSSRLLLAEDCADLMVAAALAIALAVDGGAREAAESGSQPDDPRDAPPMRRRAPVADARHAAGLPDEPATVGARKPTSIRWSVGAEAVVDFGALPEPAAGIAAEVRAGLGPWGLALHGMLLPAQRLGVREDRFVDFKLGVAGVRGCRSLLDDGRLGASACASFEAGLLDASGENLGDAREVATPWLAPGAALEARAQLVDAVQLRVRLEPLLPLLRKKYVINGTEPVHAASAVEVRLYLGFALGAP